MKTAFTSQQKPQALARLNDIMTQAGQAANEAVAFIKTSIEYRIL